MKRIYLILTGISLILLSSCAQRAREAKGHQTVKIDTVVSADKQTFLQFPGKVKAAQDISLAFRVSGTISKIHVKDGARDLLDSAPTPIILPSVNKINIS